jgi:uncharacterized protein YheU (UPF0270 family)
MAGPLDIPFENLSKEALIGVISDYVLREGTDYGHQEWELSSKIEQVLTKIKAGEAKVVFDPKTETCSIVACF